METKLLKVQDLTFEITVPEGDEGVPAFEIENSTSAILVRFDMTQALALRDLLNRFIEGHHA